MSKHTRGPWRLDRSGSRIIAPHATDHFGTTPVTVVDLAGAMGGDDSGADARLIAKAPEMYDLLKETFLLMKARWQEDLAVKREIESLLAEIDDES